MQFSAVCTGLQKIFAVALVTETPYDNNAVIGVAIFGIFMSTLRYVFSAYHFINQGKIYDTVRDLYEIAMAKNLLGDNVDTFSVPVDDRRDMDWVRRF